MPANGRCWFFTGRWARRCWHVGPAIGRARCLTPTGRTNEPANGRCWFFTGRWAKRCWHVGPANGRARCLTPTGRTNELVLLLRGPLGHALLAPSCSGYPLPWACYRSTFLPRLLRRWWGSALHKALGSSGCDIIVVGGSGRAAIAFWATVWEQTLRRYKENMFMRFTRSST